MSKSTKLIDVLLEETPALPNVITKDGRQYIMPDPYFHRPKEYDEGSNDYDDEHGWENGMCYEENSEHGLVCEREKGHPPGCHIAWTSYSTGRLYEGGIWYDD